MTANILFVTCIIFACGSLGAQTNVWQPSPGHAQVPIWPGAVPDAQPVAGPEAVVSNADWVVLNPNVPVTSNTPPTFLLQAEDDHVDDVEHSLVYYRALKKAGVLVEMHLYAQGGHASGLRRTKFAITEWPQSVEKWLGTIGMTGTSGHQQ